MEYRPSETLRNHLNTDGQNPAGVRINITSLYFSATAVVIVVRFLRNGRGSLTVLQKPASLRREEPVKRERDAVEQIAEDEQGSIPCECSFGK